MKEQENGVWIRGKEYWYKIPFMMTYGMLGTQEAWDEAMRLGEEMEQEVLWNETNREQEKTLRKYLAKAYETEGENEKAAAEYERVKELEDSREGLEEIYLRLEKLYEEEIWNNPGRYAASPWNVFPTLKNYGWHIWKSI